MKPKLVIHGGAGLIESKEFTAEDYHRELVPILKQTYRILEDNGAREAVLTGIRLFEENTTFNAGLGSRLQRDGQARMSAAIIDSKSRNFSGVINIENIKHPIDVANILSKARHKVLSGKEATLFALKKHIPPYNPVTKERWKEHLDESNGETGTVGIVGLDDEMNICAGTSTGGIGFETPGRVSDSATVAGTYASEYAGVSCTGRGEHIVNMAVAAKVVSFVESGLTLREAVNRVMKQARRSKARFGLISLDHSGNIIVANMSKIQVLYAKHDGKNMETFHEQL